MSALILWYTIVNNELCDALLIFLIFSIFLNFFAHICTTRTRISEIVVVIESCFTPSQTMDHFIPHLNENLQAMLSQVSR